MLRYLLLALFFALLPLSAGAKDTTEILLETKLKIEPACHTLGTCSVREVGFWTRDYRIGPNDDPLSKEQYFGAEIYSWYETDSLSTLEDYVFVQFIRGCMFDSYLEKGKRRVEFTISRSYLNTLKQEQAKRRVTFRHKEWTVDAGGIDPAYKSGMFLFPKSPSRRHYFKEWNNTPDEFPEYQGTLYGKKLPKHPRLFMTDVPSGAFWNRDELAEWAQNTSLEFRTCLYRTKDVPETYKEGDTLGAEPIACFPWRSSYIFNHTTKRFESPDTITPECDCTKDGPKPFREQSE